jgi:hypothetical protein
MVILKIMFKRLPAESPIIVIVLIWFGHFPAKSPRVEILPATVCLPLTKVEVNSTTNCISLSSTEQKNKGGREGYKRDNRRQLKYNNNFTALTSYTRIAASSGSLAKHYVFVKGAER